jgi:hypothetical protein
MGFSKQLLFVLGVVLTLLCTSSVRAGVIIGPGDVVAVSGGGSNTQIVIDLANRRNLSAGNYEAKTFSYQYGSSFSGLPTGGTTQPALFTLESTNRYRAIALGDFVPYTGATGFNSVAFGGSANFTLTTAQDVYAGFYQDSPSSVLGPLGLKNVGSSYVIEDNFNNPVFPPVVGNVYGGGRGDRQSTRTYDFSIAVDTAAGGAAVPEPSTCVVLAMAGLAIARRKLRRGHRAADAIATT